MERFKLQMEYSDDLSGGWVGRGETLDKELSWESLSAEDLNEIRGHRDGEERETLTYIPGVASAHPELREKWRRYFLLQDLGRGN